MVKTRIVFCKKEPSNKFTRMTNQEKSLQEKAPPIKLLSSLIWELSKMWIWAKAVNISFKLCRQHHKTKLRRLSVANFLVVQNHIPKHKALEVTHQESTLVLASSTGTSRWFTTAVRKEGSKITSLRKCLLFIELISKGQSSKLRR